MKIDEVSEFMIKPLTNYVFIEGCENPHLKTMTDSGLYLPSGLTATESEGAGRRIEAAEQFVRYGKVVEVGNEVKTLTVGDGVFFRINSVTPIPFGKLGVLLTNEQNVLAYVRGEV